MGPVSCLETSEAITNQRCVTSQKNQDLRLRRFLIYYQQSTILKSVAILLLRISEKKKCYNEDTIEGLTILDQTDFQEIPT